MTVFLVAFTPPLARYLQQEELSNNNLPLPRRPRTDHRIGRAIKTLDVHHFAVGRSPFNDYLYSFTIVVFFSPSIQHGAEQLVRGRWGLRPAAAAAVCRWMEHRMRRCNLWLPRISFFSHLGVVSTLQSEG